VVVDPAEDIGELGELAEKGRLTTTLLSKYRAGSVRRTALR